MRENNNSKIEIGSICCGMGGFDEGLRQAGFHTKWAIDIMPEACESFKANHPDTRVICEDTHKINDFNKLGQVKGLVFGIPCQGFSRANAKRSMQDKRNYVYLATLKALMECNAEFFVFENVIGILDMMFDDGSSVFEKMKSDYENCSSGYEVSYEVIDCAKVGVPQLNRLRLIMVGFRKDLQHKYEFSDYTHGLNKKPYITLKDTIWQLKDKDQTGLYYDGPYDWKFLSRNRQKPWDSPSFTIEASARYAKLHPDYGKMKWVSENKWKIPESCRRLSTLECKLLQTFNENYKVIGSLEKQYEQIGNSVPPRLAYFIGKPIITYYQKIYLEQQLKLNPYNYFYLSLLDRINNGKELTINQVRYIKIC